MFFIYILRVESILGKLPVVPVGDTGTILFSMLQDAEDFLGVALDTKERACDSNRWRYINARTLSWPRERAER
jgi:hypothetical protein